MRIKYFIICLLASVGIVNAQFQNYVLQTPDNASKTYIGRDYVRLLPGYSFSASSGKALDAKVSSTLAAADVNSFLAAANPTGSTNTDALTAINTSMAVGQIPISSTISPTGAKCYNVPIDIVEGRQGFQPNISLSYNSQAGNGVVGMGWSINGLSSIQCVNKNIFFNGENAAPSATMSGEYALDGVRLIKKSMQQTGNDACFEINYETVQGNTKVTAYVIRGLVIYFKVLYPNGTIGILGNINGPASGYIYPITQLTDLNGNVITFSYLPSDTADLNGGSTNEVHYIDEINYGQCGNMSNFAKIKFSYEDRTDKIFSLQSGKSCIFRNRLSKIESTVNSNIVRSYQLTYINTDPRITSNQNDFSRLSQIDCSVSTTESLNPLKFQYGETGNLSIVTNNTSLDYVDLSGVNFIRGKFDINSQNDALLAYPKGSFYTESAYNESLLNYPADNKIKIYQDIDNPGSTYKTLPGNAESGLIGILSADIDGAGNDEVVKINSSGIAGNEGDIETVKFKIYKPDKETGLLFSREEDVTFNSYLCYTDYDSPNYYSIDPKKFFTGDFTGHGVTEVLIVPANSPISIINLNNANANETKHLYAGNISLDSNSSLIYPVDIDGDGQTEIVYITNTNTVIYKYKENQGFVQIATWSIKKSDFDNRSVFFSDINGDGNMDIVISPKAPSPFLKKYTYSAKNFEVGRVLKCPNCGFITDGSATACMNNNIPSFSGGKANYRQFFTSSHDPVSCIQKCVNCGMNFTYEKESNDHTYCVWCNRLITQQSGGGCPTHGVIVANGVYSSTYRKYLSYDYDFQSPNIYDYTYDDQWRYIYSDGLNINKDMTISSFKFLVNQNYYIQDMDGDGIPELVVNNYVDFNNSIVRFYPFSHKDLSFINTPFSVTFPSHANSLIIPVDLNSSAKSQKLLLIDCVEFGISSVHLSKDHVGSNMISLMINSLGVADKTSYSLLYQGANYTPNTQAVFPYTDFSGPLYVTIQSSRMFNKQLVGNTIYSYTGAILHKQGLGLCGFSTMKITDLMTNKESITEFDPIHLGVVTKQTSDTQESVLRYDFTTWSNAKMTPLLTNKTITDKLKRNTATITYSGYDAYGNTGKEVTDFGGGIKSTVDYTYDNRISTNLNLIGLPTNRTVTSERDGKLSVLREGFEYYATDNRLHFHRKYIGSNLASETEYKYFTNYGTVSDEIVHTIPTNEYLTTSYQYDTDNYSLLTKTDPQKLVTTYTNDLTNRRVTGMTDYLGKKTTYGYDNWRRKNKEIRPDLTTMDIRWDWNISDMNHAIAQTQTATGQPTSVSYVDVFGRETRKSMAGFDDGTFVFSDKEYDNFGRLRSISAPYKSGESPLLTTYSYDDYDRTNTIVHLTGSITSYAYSGNSVTENKDGISVTKTTDPIGKLISSSDAGGTVSYIYRPDGQPDNINAAGVTTSFEYSDPYNRQTKLVDPSAGTIGTVYDDANHTVTQTWNSGKQIKTVSNKFGQPVSKVTPDFTTTYNYDPTYGRPTGSTSTNETSKSIDYDNYGRLWKQTETANGKTYQAVYGYDNGRIGRVDYNTGTNLNSFSSVIYKYKNNGYLYRLEDASGNRLSEVNSVNALGLETNVLLGNGLTTTKNYTSEGLCTNIQTGTIQNMSFNFNQTNGTLNSRTDNLHGLSESFTYDNLYRLKSYGPAFYHQTMDYSANGNISTKTDAGNYGYAQSATPYQLTGLTSIPTKSLGLTTQLDVNYTVNSRPTNIGYGDYTATFSYNDTYDRTYEQIKQGGTELLSKTYLDGGKYEIETSGGVEKQRLYLDGSPYTASILVEKVGGAAAQTYYLHRDYLGSITQITDNSANLAAEYSYDAWGRMRNPVDWKPYDQGAQPTLLFGRGYTGHEHLNQFGIINMNARLYDPVLGRFYAPDPNVDAPETTNGYNRYVYALNNPMMYVDINGEDGNLWNYWGGSYNPSGSSYPNNSQPMSPYNPDFNLPYLGNYNNFNSGYGDYSGFSGNYGGSGNGFGSLIVGFLSSLFNSGSGSGAHTGMKYSGDGAAHAYVKTSPAKAPGGLGVPKVSSGGGNRLISAGTSSSGFDWKGSQYGIPVWGACQQASDALSNGDYLNWACYFGLGFFEVFTFGEGAEVRLEMNAAKMGGRVFWSGEGAMDAAMKYAKSTGGTTLEMTRAGQNLQKLIQTKNIPWSEARPMWQRLSTKFAQGAESTVHFFPGETVNSGSIWLDTEKPILLNNGVNIITH